MKRLFTALSLSLMMGSVSLSYASLPQKSDSSIPSLISSLNLKESQIKKLEPIYSDRDTQLKAMQEDKSLSEEARRTKLNAINQNINEALRTILTQSQKKKLNEMRRK